MRSLIELPPEILHEICCRPELEDEYLCCLRLVCKHLDPIAEKVVFQVIYLDPNITSMQNLQALSQVPRLALHVRQICFEAACYDVLSKEEWQQKVNRYPSNEISWTSEEQIQSILVKKRDESTVAGIEGCYQAYLGALQQQADFLSQTPAERYKQLCAIFSRLPNIEILECYAGDNSKYFTRPGNEQGAIKIYRSQLDTLMTPCQSQALVESLAIYLLASFKLAARLKEICFEDIPALAFETFSQLQSSLVTEMQPQMEKVTVLYLTIALKDALDSESMEEVPSPYALMSMLPNLEDLTYFSSHDHTEWHETPRPSKMMFVSPRLRAVNLGNFSTGCGDFEQLILDLPGSVQLLRLGDIILLDGSWVEAFENIRSHLPLERFQISSTLAETKGCWFVHNNAPDLEPKTPSTMDRLICLRQTDQQPFQLSYEGDSEEQWAKASDETVKWVAFKSFGLGTLTGN